MDMGDPMGVSADSEAPGSTVSISAAARETGLSIDGLRYYERAGLMLEPIERAGSGQRRYTERDISWVVFLTKLRRTGMPIRRIRAYADLVRAGRGNEDARLALLRVHRDAVLEQVNDVQRTLASIEKKIESYQARTRSIEPDLAEAR